MKCLRCLKWNGIISNSNHFALLFFPLRFDTHYAQLIKMWNNTSGTFIEILTHFSYQPAQSYIFGRAFYIWNVNRNELWRDLCVTKMIRLSLLWWKKGDKETKQQMIFGLSVSAVWSFRRCFRINISEWFWPHSRRKMLSNCQWSSLNVCGRSHHRIRWSKYDIWLPFIDTKILTSLRFLLTVYIN